MSSDYPLRLAVDVSSRALLAVHEAGDHPAAPTPDALRLAVLAQGWPEDVLDGTLVAAFLEACRTGTAEVCLPVGQTTDGSVEVELAADRMSALLSIVPPRGGAPATEAQVRAALQEAGVVAGLREDILRQALARGHCEAVVVAEGRTPMPGTPTRFENLLDDPPAPADHDDHALVDYRNLGNLTLVAPGHPLMRRIPATPGVAGENVLGEPVAPPPQPDTPFARDLTGVEPDPDDPCLLRAAIAGVPVVLAQGVHVSSLLEVDAVDLTSGNVVFDGSLKVRGDITMGMEVRVTGDVAVSGTIEAARVHADGNITVNGGIIGMADNMRDAAGHARTARISCGGSVKARFISNAEVRAARDVAVEREIRQSEIIAGDSVRVGPPGSQSGAITGGSVHALKSVQAGTLGSLSAMPTVVRVGLDPYADEKHAALRRERAELAEQQDKLEKLVLFLASNPQKDVGGLGERCRNTLEQARLDMAQLQAREAQLARELLPLQTATITASRRFHGGVTLYLGGRMQEFLEGQVGGKATLAGDQIVIR
ncbi:DUF342 domain-containing protein [Bordetella sp. 2513F-2]